MKYTLLKCFLVLVLVNYNNVTIRCIEEDEPQTVIKALQYLVGLWKDG